MWGASCSLRANIRRCRTIFFVSLSSWYFGVSFREKDYILAFQRYRTSGHSAIFTDKTRVSMRLDMSTTSVPVDRATASMFLGYTWTKGMRSCAGRAYWMHPPSFDAWTPPCFRLDAQTAFAGFGTISIMRGQRIRHEKTRRRQKGRKEKKENEDKAK